MAREDEPVPYPPPAPRTDEVSPGPWRCEKDWGWEVIDAKGTRVALLDPVPGVFNADLIAAAPEMLALLRRWAVPIGTWDDMDDLQGKTEELLTRIDRKEAPR